MSNKYLVVVESPAKARTIKKYLGKDFEVMASYGHVRDLVPKGGAVDPACNFAMKYQLIEKNAKHVDAIVKSLEELDGLYLATDPDREGEAISWHLYEILRERGALAKKSTARVVFHEITQKAIREAVENPRELSTDLINAQQARRALDYLVGFNLSPLLWKKVRMGLSAGRVQSPALRLIAEREEAIEAFIAREYWTLEASWKKKEGKQDFAASLIQYQNNKIEQFSIVDQKQAKQVHKALEKAAQGLLVVKEIEKKKRKRNPSPPFTTSTLQQEASRKLFFPTDRTMKIAQQLYEAGHITYMRTDSVNLAEEAVSELREVIAARFGAEKLPEKPHVYKTRAKNAQEAHEAIRPTMALRTPDQLIEELKPEQHKLYDLIWKRAISCQMIPALLQLVAIDLAASDQGIFRATGSTIVEAGFMAVYQEGQDDTPGEEDEKLLPALKEGEVVVLNHINSVQHFTEPPPRYNEASLVKTLEEYGIGRPSTYSSILSTLVQRGYVTLDNRRFYPTDVGRVVSRFLTEHFEQYVDYDFTAKLEDGLDSIARGEKEWIPLLKSFWSPFKTLVDEKTKGVSRQDVTQEPLDENCSQCGKPLVKRLGRRGLFVGCSGYPECDYTRNLDQSGEKSSEPEVVPDRTCPQCHSPLHFKQGRYGRFIGCSQYPQCTFIESAEKPSDTGITCPICGQGTLVKRRSRFNKIFYSCQRYPDCQYAVWNEPVAESCPQCQWPIVTIKVTKRKGTQKVCPQKECGFAITVEVED